MLLTKEKTPLKEQGLRILKIILTVFTVSFLGVSLIDLSEIYLRAQWPGILATIAIAVLLILFFLEILPHFISRRIAKFRNQDEIDLSRADFDSFVKKSMDEFTNESEDESEVKIFRNAIDFSSMKLRDCMVPRADIVAVSKDIDIEKLKEIFIETGLSRILVYKNDIDDIIGYIHMWEMFSDHKDWTTNIANISFVPESMQASRLMSDLMQQRKSIAVVVDEFGGTSGIITMEDLVEEIFGEIEDEYDVKSSFIKQESEKEYVLSGRVEIDHINEKYGLGIPEGDEYSTIAGYLLHHTQRFPKTYESIVIGNHTFKILKVTERKIEVVRLVVNDLT